MIRGKHLELQYNSNYDMINGLPKRLPEIPHHDVYNPKDQIGVKDRAGKLTRVNSNIYLTKLSLGTPNLEMSMMAASEP